MESAWEKMQKLFIYNSDEDEYDKAHELLNKIYKQDHNVNHNIQCLLFESEKDAIHIMTEIENKLSKEINNE